MEPREPVIGYTGFVPKMDDAFLGTSYGTATTKVLKPQLDVNHEYPTSSTASSFPETEHAAVPGYGGHLPHIRNEVGDSFGKLVDKSHETQLDLTLNPRKPVHRPVRDVPSTVQDSEVFVVDSKGVPGYQGYIPGVDAMFGKTHAKIAKESAPTSVHNNEDYHNHNVCNEQIENSDKLVPGYTGFVKGMNDQFGKTYGKASEKCLNREAQPFRVR
eukprot:TRINITY_DN1666_c0_g1_i1.p1 TRINITY_DN1666_c0_g1~~TRINITY_DN1666_c0_g1_i1.p1  ORF type:complete len:225 (+),score=58.25 TRINITY_DN1666_c0_g1_i1:33-677(+)